MATRPITHSPVLHQPTRIGFTDLYWVTCTAYERFEKDAEEPVCNFRWGYGPKDVAERHGHDHVTEVMNGTYELYRRANGAPWL